jgi:BA14K-like protein
MEFVMTVRSMLLASALMAVGGIWAGSASAAPIHADMSLQGGGLVEQVQMRGHGSGGGRGPGMSAGRSGGGGMSFGRSSGGGSGMSFRGSGGSGMGISRSGGNWSGNRAIGSGNFATSNRQSFAATNGPRNWSGNNWNGRRADFRRHRGFRGPAFAFGFGPSYYDYGYDYGYDSGYYPYDDDAYAYVAPGAAVADGDSAGYCQQRFRSYDPSTGTYLGYDGLRHPCP